MIDVLAAEGSYREITTHATPAWSVVGTIFTLSILVLAVFVAVQ